jgi:hypothetical protein
MLYNTSWTTVDACKTVLTSPLDPNASSGPVPCSLDTTTPRLWNLADAPDVYTTLDTGISDVVANFNNENFTSLMEKLETGSAGSTQIITHVDTKTNLSHSFLFTPFAAFEYDYPPFLHVGYDIWASTTSMVTECRFATHACHLTNHSSSSNPTLSIPFNCSEMFSGDLNQAPLDGLEQFKGWDSSFYDMADGQPRNISVQSQLNPFHFNISTALTSISATTLLEEGDPGTSQVMDGSIVDAGNGRVAFALSCTATIYDVTFALINGSIAGFNATVSDPRKASIIKAPLQVGFGRCSLYRSASLAVLSYNYTAASLMGPAFSQVGMALASGAFASDFNIAQRQRWDQLLTVVPFAPLWFLVVACLLYAALGLGVTAAALVLRRKQHYSDVQARLLPKIPITLRELLINC